MRFAPQSFSASRLRHRPRPSAIKLRFIAAFPTLRPRFRAPPRFPTRTVRKPQAVVALDTIEASSSRGNGPLYLASRPDERSENQGCSPLRPVVFWYAEPSGLRDMDARKRAYGSIRATTGDALSFSSPVPKILIVAEASAARGLRTVRVDIRSSARSAAANRAAALGRIGWRGIGSTSPVGAIGLCIRALHPNGHSQNAHAYESDESALHHDLPLQNKGGSRLRRMR